MARHGFGKGEYRYYKYPLPDLIGGLRTALYPYLADIANGWSDRMGVNQLYPKEHADFLRQCHEAGQVRPTPLLLQYVPGISTAFTKTSTANLHFLFRLRSCWSPAGILPGANLF